MDIRDGQFFDKFKITGVLWKTKKLHGGRKKFPKHLWMSD